MFRKLLLATLGLAAASLGTAQTATFGIRVPIGGEATDLAIDQPRGVLYIANFTASRIDRMNLATFQLQTPIKVDPNPISMSLSPDLRWLLVAHYDNPKTGVATNNHLTLIDLVSGARSTLALPQPPLAVSFGADNQAFVVTTTEFFQYDPGSNSITSLGTIADLAPKVTPVSGATFPPDITAASVSQSGDGLTIYGVGGTTETITFIYDVPTHTVVSGGIVLASGTVGPRVVSVSQDGTAVMVGWIMLKNGAITNFVPQSDNQFSVGTSLIDDSRGLIYAQIPTIDGEPPVLQILAEDNLTVTQKLRLPENTKGKSIFNPQSSVMYSISDSGVLVLPVGYLNSMSRVTTSAPSLFFRGNFCDNATISRTLTVTNPGGGGSGFAFKPTTPGITVSPAAGITPATVTVTVDPSAFSALHGTESVDLGLTSSDAINVIDPVKVLVNHPDPNQRGTILEVPGTLVDILADPTRDRYYVLRQDNNTLLVFDGANNTQIKTLRTNNVPTSMAISFDHQYIYIGHDESQTLAIYNLDDFTRRPDVSTDAGNGNVVRSLAVSANKIIATSRDYKSQGHILLIDPVTLTATQPESVGLWENKIAVGSVAVANENGNQVMVATPDGFTYLYDAGVADFTVSRNDFTALTGPYAATSGIFSVGDQLLNGSLVPFLAMDKSSGQSASMVFSAGAVRTGAATSTGPGFAERVNFSNGTPISPTLTVEAPLLPLPNAILTNFIRSLAVFRFFHNSFVSLSQSGLTLLAANYDAPLPQPVISSVTSAADGASPVASGGLISIGGANFSTSTVASGITPLPTVLGNSCVLVNGKPISLLLVSPSLINAQLDGSTGGAAIMSIRTPQNVSPDFSFNVLSNAPAVFLNGQAGESTNLPALYRVANGLLVTDSNPVRRNDSLTIYAAGLGLTSPVVAAGAVSPSNPLAMAVVQPTVTLNGTGLPVVFAGLAPGQIGVYQISVNVPNTVPLGLSVPLTITQGKQSQTVNVRVVN